MRHQPANHSCPSRPKVTTSEAVLRYHVFNDAVIESDEWDGVLRTVTCVWGGERFVYVVHGQTSKVIDFQRVAA